MFNICLIKDTKVDYDWDNDVTIKEDYFYATNKGMVVDEDEEIIYMSPDINKNHSERYSHIYKGYEKIALMLNEKKIDVSKAIAMAKDLETE